ncbi:hypothetical protein J4230_03520 [Candidatus Woesearchaeota archaeon]|nr:hypothetical protein [Candidatus Woesearchaeota archaeon]
MEKEVKKWIEKLEAVKKGNIDLSRDEDLSIALMNLVSLEEHFYFTAMKTNNQNYLEMLNSVRELRKNLLGRIVKNPKGEEWCISKHLLASSMRLMEVGTKELSKKNIDESNMFFQKAFDLYSLFFAINTNMVEAKELSNLDKEEKNKSSMLSKFSLVIKKIVDCCKE